MVFLKNHHEPLDATFLISLQTFLGNQYVQKHLLQVNPCLVKNLLYFMWIKFLSPFLKIEIALLARMKKIQKYGFYQIQRQGL